MTGPFAIFEAFERIVAYQTPSIPPEFREILTHADRIYRQDWLRFIICMYSWYFAMSSPTTAFTDTVSDSGVRKRHPASAYKHITSIL